MTSFFIRFLVIIIALWFLRRILASVFGEPTKRTRANPGNRAPTAANPMVKDPVCGMYMDPRLAVELQSRGGQFYFCSNECRQKFIKLGHTT